MKEVTYYPGCSLHGTAREYDESFRGVSKLLDIGLHELEDWTCCGSTSAHCTDEALAWARERHGDVRLSRVEFNRVFAVRKENLTVGTPLVADAKGPGAIVRNDRAAKVRVLKDKRKKQYRRTAGHRQGFSEVRITSIVTA